MFNMLIYYCIIHQTMSIHRALLDISWTAQLIKKNIDIVKIGPYHRIKKLLEVINLKLVKGNKFKKKV